MISRTLQDVSATFLDDDLVEDALNAAVRDAVQLHKEKGLPLVVWRDSKAVWISPEEAERTLSGLSKSK